MGGREERIDAAENHPTLTLSTRRVCDVTVTHVIVRPDASAPKLVMGGWENKGVCKAGRIPIPVARNGKPMVTKSD